MLVSNHFNLQIITTYLRLLLLGCTVISISNCSQSYAKPPNNAMGKYQCLPCGYNCDTKTHTTPGTCENCHMELVDNASIIFDNITTQDVCSYIAKHPNVVLLDVRTKAEFNGKASPNFGTLKNAINIPLQELENRLAGMVNLKNKDIIVFCSHSHRSPQASYLLSQNGFKNITNMLGGMSVMQDNNCKQ